MRSQAVRAWLLLLSLGLGLKFSTSKRWGIARPKRDGRGSPWDKIVLSDQPQEAAPQVGPLLEETQQRKKTWALKRPKLVNRNGRTEPRAARRRTHNPGSSVQEPSQHTFRLSKLACSWELAKYAATYSRTHRCRCVEWQSYIFCLLRTIFTPFYILNPSTLFHGALLAIHHPLFLPSAWCHVFGLLSPLGWS
jgi:hypothetical protein